MNGTRTSLSSRSINRPVSSGRIETIRTLTITQFDESDTGFYRCLLTRSFVVWRSHDEVYLSVKGRYHCLLYNLKSCLSPFLAFLFTSFLYTYIALYTT